MILYFRGHFQSRALRSSSGGPGLRPDSRRLLPTYSMEHRDLIVRDLDPFATEWPTPGDGEWPNIRTRFPHGTRVAREPVLRDGERVYWILVGEERAEDWNYWLKCVNATQDMDLEIRACVPHWGRSRRRSQPIRHMPHEG